MNIVVVGTGYVGLVTGTCFAEVGINVTCVDIDEDKINKLKNGIIPIYEPGLETLVKKNIEKKRLFFSTTLKDCLHDADVVFIAVGTPPDEDGSADLKHVLNVASEIGKYMTKPLLIVNKSTVPVGTAQKVKEVISKELFERGEKINFEVASNPEFLKEGAAIEDFMKPDRIICGVESANAKEIFQKLYKPFTLNGHPIIFMDIPSAEMTKYAANAMLATRISFMNDIANLCELVGANINDVRKGIGSDTRIGNKFIYPGVGYGGSCFPKDVKALIKIGEEKGYKLKILTAVEEINNKQKTILFEKLHKYYNGNLKEKTITVWGLSFKPKTDDMREAPSLTIINKLIENNCIIKVYDPVAMDEAKKILTDKVTYSPDIYDSVIDSEALLLVTEWNEFRFPNWNVIKRLMKKHVVFDGRNIYDANELISLGFDYFCIGVNYKK